ncbi:MAG TPA: UDP-N-acetylglucosamine--N-acetylmuramyl-(pentapeptide) pyrophosphoryl-undecaprenol N-acetylglucosamine transferase [Fibrobacteria bacterium]|nr:UDP-N-acetylglucosamine--N-acetylmuramyl-(pentapeptide) pyrophosphoryl-undecaprenol N-acetylglucosamine transferase [Fibrobacteria bacterium]
MGLKVALACGGTGGHVFPALAVGKVLREEHGAELVVVGRPSSSEETWARQAGIAFRGVRAVPLHRTRVWRNLALPFVAGQAVSQAKQVLSEEGVQVVFATGGYVCLPAGIASRRLGLPLVVHEANSHPGVANRILARLADRVFAGSPAGAARLPRGEVVGNPVRPLDGRTRQQMREALGLSEGDRFLVVIGGSQGARGVNRILCEESQALVAKGWKILWQTGAAGLDEARQVAASLEGVRVEAFVPDVYGAFGAADLALTRSGGSTLGELALHGLPSVLVPFPSATGNHQEINAREYEAAGAATVVLESQWKPGLAADALENLWRRREDAAQAMKGFGRPRCAHDLARAVVDAARAAGRPA